MPDSVESTDDAVCINSADGTIDGNASRRNRLSVSSCEYRIMAESKGTITTLS